MAKEIVTRCIIWCAVFWPIFQTTSANEQSWFLPTKYVNGHCECKRSGFQTTYSLNGNCTLAAKYRTIDGSCNHMSDHIQGQAFTPFKRYLPSDYKDDIGAPQTHRPSPLEIRRGIFEANTNESLEINLNVWFVIFGQFLIHDFAFAQKNTGSFNCCTNSPNMSECIPIKVKPDDELSFRNVACLNFVRSLGVGPITGEPGPRQQLNIITHYLDASNVYGSSEKELDLLLDYETGKLKVTDLGNNPFLPTRDKIEPLNNCPLFDAGDNRVNENIILAVHHLIWVREHNLILDKLAKVNPEWDTETLFEETRRIIIAEMQFITYTEFLPLLIGEELIEEYFLGVNYSHYDPSRNAAISNAFTTAVFRYGHTMVDDFVYSPENSTDYAKRNCTDFCICEFDSFFCNTTRIVPVLDSLGKVDTIYSCQNSVDAFIEGSVYRLSQSSNDFRVSEKLLGHLPNIHDLISFNIQRGRDHGLPSYNSWRTWCGLEPLDFQSNTTSHPKPIFDKLKSIYAHGDDIDLFVGGVLEENIKGAVLGPTFACISAKQFSDTKFGDRFWYQLGQFSPEQIEEIHNQSMSKIIMRNTGIHSLPINSFMCPFENNPEIPRTESDFDISQWISTK